MTKPAKPADIVSIMLAQRLAESKQNRVFEKSLNYGQVKDPSDGAVIPENRNIDEDQLFMLRGPTLELKNSIFDPSGSDPETVETSEESDETTKAPKGQFVPNKLNYHQIGYQPSDSKTPNYVIVPSSSSKKSHKKSCRHHNPRTTASPSETETATTPSNCGCAKNLVVDVVNRFPNKKHHYKSPISVPSLIYSIST